ncbi:unnamed protein product [Trichogramma brassicae]|uniref:Uncharacterized protein n=1 Tax=Trichogramma brassicae TaxID=86971 RepID=A0A6H5IIW7_9HYME|nr:unnamed protein product [Trichogramma brassicae]
MREYMTFLYRGDDAMPRRTDVRLRHILQQEREDVMSNDIELDTEFNNDQPDDQANAQAYDQPNDQPADQPDDQPMLEEFLASDSEIQIEQSMEEVPLNKSCGCSRNWNISLLCPPGWPIRCTRYKYNLVDDFPQASRDVFATLSTQVAFSVHQPQRRLSPRTSRCFRYFVHLGGLFGCTRYKYNFATTPRWPFPQGSRDIFSRYFDTPGGLFGAPGTNTAPTTTFSQEVEMFSLLCPPRWPIRCTSLTHIICEPQQSRLSAVPSPKTSLSWAEQLILLEKAISISWLCTSLSHSLDISPSLAMGRVSEISVMTFFVDKGST